MGKHTAESLKEMIVKLEAKQAEEGKILKEQVHETLEYLRPGNILKSIVKEFYNSEGLLDEIINTAVSITSGFVTKKVIVGKSRNRYLKLLGLAMQYGMTTVIAKKFHALKEKINQFISGFLGEKEVEVNDEENEKEMENEGTSADK